MPAASEECAEFLRELRARGRAPDPAVEAAVRAILEDVRQRGDAAVLAHTERLDGVRLDAQTLRVPEAECDAALASLDPGVREALALAADRIGAFHARQRRESWFAEEAGTGVLGQLVRPLRRVGLYVPGGSAAYPSSVLMNAIPATVAGVGEVVMCTPAGKGGSVAPAVLAAARLAGVREIYRIGGAQAVAALAYGTETIPRVDKITGPGNIYVATAKKLVFGQAGIDMIAGPSEILVINDGSGTPAHIAADLLSQAEHDELASSILITTDRGFGEAVAAQVELQLQQLSRQAIARASWDRYGAIIVTSSLDEAVAFSNSIAPEHLELAVSDPFALLPQITNAGAIFMGHWTPEAAGDYLAGPNHTLPTGGTARFFSPLSVDDFVKKSSLIYCSRAGLQRLGPDVERLAGMEGLKAHARSVTVRKG